MTGNATLTTSHSAYVDLLLRYQPKAIQTAEECETAISIMEQIDHNPQATQAEKDLAELLTILVMHFEEENAAFPLEMQATPLEILKVMMEERNLKQADLVGIIGSRGVVSEVYNGKRAINKNMAFKLGDFFNIDPGFFLGTC